MSNLLLTVPRNATVTLPQAAGPDGQPLTVKLGCQLRAAAPAHVPKLTALFEVLRELRSVSLPRTLDRTQKAAAGLRRMLVNNRKGCCVVSATGHLIFVWSAEDGSPEPNLTDDEVETLYDRLSPYDQGLVISDFLDGYKRYGYPLGGKTDRIDDYVAVNTPDPQLVKAAVYLFGGLNVGFAVTDEWRSTARPGFLWRRSSSPVVGGHSVPPIGWDDNGFVISTWGMTGTMAYDVFADPAVVSEGYGILSSDWYGLDQRAAAVGLDAARLRDALKEIGGGQVPDIGVSPPPVPVSPPPAPTPPKPVRYVVTGTAAGNVTGTLRVPLFGTVPVSLAASLPVTGSAVPESQPASPPPSPDPGPGGNDHFRGPAEGILPDLSGLTDLIGQVRELVQKGVRIEQEVEDFFAWVRSMPVQSAAPWFVGTDGEKRVQAVGLSWADVAGWAPLILKYAGLVVPVVIAGKAAGKSNLDILKDVIAALVANGVTADPPARLAA